MKLAVETRDLQWKEAKELRKEGKIPCVVYGKHLGKTISILIGKVDLVKAYKKAGRSTPVELSGEGIEQLVLFHDVQLDPVSDHMMHVDFLAVDKNVAVEAEVPVELIGKSELAKQNLGRVQQLRSYVNVEALPLDLPHDIKIDVSGIAEIGEVIFVKDLDLGDKVTILDEADLAIASAVEFTEEEPEEDELADLLPEGELEEGEEGEEWEWEEGEGWEDDDSEEEK